MVILLKFLFCTFILSIKLTAVLSELYSSSYTTLKFSQCLIEKISESQFFTPEDRNNMNEVADVLVQAIKNVEYGPFSVKVLLTAFVTSLADVILTQDISENNFRKGVYAASLEQCSMSTVGYIDSDFIKECLRIVSSLEEREITKLLEGSSFKVSDSSSGIHNLGIYPQQSDSFDPYAVDPSPVQHPFIPVKSDVNDKTIIGQQQRPPDFSFSPPLHSVSRSRHPAKSESDTHITSLDASVGSQTGKDFLSEQHKPGIPSVVYDYSFDESLVVPSFEYGELNVSPPKQSSQVKSPDVPQTHLHASSEDQSVPQTDGNFQRPMQPESNKKYPLGLDGINGDTEPEKSDSTVLSDNSQKFSFNPVGLNVPQMKESSVVVISPNIKAHNVENAPSQDHYLPPELETLYPQRTETSSPQKKSPISMPSSVSIAQADELVQKSEFIPTLETLISDILINSTDFKNAFSSGINKHNAIRLARVITEQSLSGYNSGIIREALNAVSDEIAKVRVNSPENYAFALSNALVSVLKLHRLPLFVHGSLIASTMLSNLDSEAPGSMESTGEQSKELAPDDSAESKVKEPSLALQTSEIVPEEKNIETFSKVFADYISESDEMSNYFCSSDISPSSLQIYFNIIKSSLDDFGERIASIGASTMSKIISETSKQNLCSNYGQIIAAAVAEILDENGLLVGANAEEISSKMVLSLIQQLYAATPAQTLKIASDSMPVESTTSLPSKDMPILQPSFSSNFDSSFQETSTLPEEYYQSSPYYQSSFEDVSQETYVSLGENDKIEPISYIFSPSPNIYEPSPIEEFGHRYEVVNDYTSPLPSDFSHEEYFFSPTWMEALISLSESSTEKPTNYNSDDIISVISDSIIDQEELASHLFEEIESVLDVLTSKNSDQETTSRLPIPSFEAEIKADETSNSSRIILDESQITQASDSVTLHQNGRKEVEKVIALSHPNTDMSSIEIEEGVENDNVTLPGHRLKIRNSRKHPEPSVSEQQAIEVSESHSNTQSPPEETQSNFEPSQSSLLATIQYELPINLQHDYEFEDASLVFARAVSRIVADSIAFMRSEDFNIWQLCDKLNQMAPILRIPPLDVCAEIPAIDYLLHVLRSTTKILKGV